MRGLPVLFKNSKINFGTVFRLNFGKYQKFYINSNLYHLLLNQLSVEADNRFFKNVMRNNYSSKFYIQVELKVFFRIKFKFDPFLNKKDPDCCGG